MAILAMALLQQHDTRRHIVIEPAARRRAAKLPSKLGGHSEMRTFGSGGVRNWGHNRTVKTHQLVLIYIVLSHIGRINKQFVWRVYQQGVLISECNEVNVIKELLSVKYKFATVSVLDWLTLFLVLRLYLLNSHLICVCYFT